MKTIFFKGKKEEIERPPEGVVLSLREAGEKLHAVPVEQILDFFDALSQTFVKNRELERDLGLSRPTSGRVEAGVSLKDLAAFLKKETLGKSLDLALRGNRKYLDGFIQPTGYDFLLRAQPRGLAVEWLAGNIPFLGIYSLAEVLATKNALLIKAPPKNYAPLVKLLERFAEQAQAHREWRAVAEAIAVAVVPNEDQETHEALSLAADSRLIWGGEESTKAILSLSKQWWTEDIVYGPKYSYALVTRDATAEESRRAAAALAIDAANFDQYACSSPHTVFVEENGAMNAEEFGGALAKEFERVSRLLLPPARADAKVVQRIMLARADYAARGRVIAPEGGGIAWTVIVMKDGEAKLEPPVGSRVVFVKPLYDLQELASINNRKIQTIGVCGMSDRVMKAFREITRLGGDRIPRVGAMNSFASPWDGMFAMDRLVRWVSVEQSAKGKGQGTENNEQ